MLGIRFTLDNDNQTIFLRMKATTPIPRKSFLEVHGLPVYELACFAIREGRRPRPIYAAHKWFARRLGCVFRALLVGATADPNCDFWSAYYGEADLRGIRVLDPFVGGGTSVVEATRLGATTFAVDVDPVAFAVTRFELEASLIPDLRVALQDLQRRVGTVLRPFHTTHDEAGRLFTVLHHFWVQVIQCSSCGFSFDAHPTFLLARDDKHQWTICASCGTIEQQQAQQTHSHCRSCGEQTNIDQGRVQYGTATCPACGTGQALIDVGRSTGSPPEFRLFALELFEEEDGGHPVPMIKRRFVTATDADRLLFAQARDLCRLRHETHPWIFPDHGCNERHRSDPRLTAYGYQRWADLFNARQLLHLTLLAEAIDQYEDPIRRALAIAFSDHLTTNCMMTAYTAGWRRLTPLFSIRAFRHIPRPVEINPWCDGTGRGTFPNAVRKLMRASEFARHPKEPMVAGGFKPVPPRSPEKPPTIICGSARDLSILPNAVIDLVLTDPPYFDNIAYSELAEFFLPWLDLLKVINDPDATKRISLESLVGRRNDTEARERYTAGLADAFSEIARVLKPSGLVIFSFRHTLPEAWLALAAALATTNLRAVSFLPVPGESGVGLHTHKGTGLWDAVFVLRKTRRCSMIRLVVTQATIDHIEQILKGWAGQLDQAPLPLPGSIA